MKKHDDEDDLPITMEDREPDSFDDFLWWVFVALSCIGSGTMIWVLCKGLAYVIRRLA